MLIYSRLNAFFFLFFFCFSVTRFDTKNSCVRVCGSIRFFSVVYFLQGASGVWLENCHQFFEYMVKGFDVLVSSHSHLFCLRKKPRAANTKRLKGGVCSGRCFNCNTFCIQNQLHPCLFPLLLLLLSLHTTLSSFLLHYTSSECPQSPTPASPGRSPPR